MKTFYINEAIKMAEKSTMCNSYHGAVVINRGKIVGRGNNKYHETINRKNIFSIHAEVSAIKDALRYISIEELKKSILIIVRVNKMGDIVCSYPCEKCREFITEMKIKSVYYS